jgi:hypothetical protein
MIEGTAHVRLEHHPYLGRRSNRAAPLFLQEAFGLFGAVFKEKKIFWHVFACLYAVSSIGKYHPRLVFLSNGRWAVSKAYFALAME